MTKLENLAKANDDYHEAVGEILADETVSVEGRVEFAVQVAQVFHHMKMANELIKPYYEVTDE